MLKHRKYAELNLMILIEDNSNLGGNYNEIWRKGNGIKRWDNMHL